MKRILQIFFIYLIANNINAQDIIVQRNSDEIRCKILEITSDAIKYKEFEFQDGPTRNINVKSVFMILYENGKRETFSNNEINEKADNENTNLSEDNYDGNHFTLGFGYGNSYGGYGMRIQWRFGGIQGFGVHLGGGYFPDAPILGSAGVKFYPYKDLYINAQFGLTGWEEYIEYGVDSSGYYYYNDESHLLMGPSLLLGGDWIWGDRVGIGFNAGAGVTYNINADYFDPLTLAFDVGFLLRF